jgi:flagellum-specific ATP synthase
MASRRGPGGRPRTPHQPPRFGQAPPARRRSIDRAKLVPVGESLLGRVLDGAGRPLDGLGRSTPDRLRPLHSRPVNPMSRAPIEQPLDVGVRAINALLCVGRGQRMGLFAGSGVGKSVLLGMMARYTEAEVIVVGLIGERGREVKEFIEQILGRGRPAPFGRRCRPGRRQPADASAGRSLRDLYRRILSAIAAGMCC